VRSIVAGIALRIKQSDVQLLAISGTGFQSGRSRYSLAPLEHFPHFAAPVLESHEDAVEALDWMVQEAAYREMHGVKRPLLVLVIDDLDALLSFNDDAPLDLLRQLLDSRAAAGVRVVMCARDVLSPEVRGLLRHNVDLRLVGRLPGERDSRAATGIPDAGTDRLPGKGAFVAVSGGEAIRFQAAFIDDYDLHLAIEMAYGRSRGALLAQPLRAAAPTLPEEDSAGKDISFRIQNGSGRAVLDSTDEEAAMYASNAAGSAEEAEAVEEELPSNSMDWEADDDVENWVEDSDEASDYSWDES
jgi:DNA segregation ATPase FtsK/SpoIIIE-like protein